MVRRPSLFVSCAVASEIDLSVYLRRIGWVAPVAPTLACLNGLIAAHAAAIPFENLNPLLGLPVLLTPEALEAKIIRGRRGGYCFEQNQLFARALRAIGFELTGLCARVLWNRPTDATPPRTHMVLWVVIDGVDYLADVGFGGQVLTGALRFEPDVPQETPHEPFRLTLIDGDWRLDALISDAWKPLYRFDLQPQQDIDYELANYYTSTSPNSHFTSSLIAARAEPGRRLVLRNRDFAVHHTGGATERRTLDDAAEICALLERDFRLRLPEHPDLARKLDALPR